MNMKWKSSFTSLGTTVGLFFFLISPPVTLSTKSFEASIQGGGIRIVSPADGSTAVAGQTLGVTIEPNSGTILQRVSAWIIPVSSIPQVVTTAPYQFQLQVPDDKLGPATVKAVAVDSNGNSLQATVRIYLVAAGPPQGIVVQPEELFFFAPGESHQIGVSAIFAGDVRRDVSKSPNTSFSSANPRVSTVGADGLVRAIAPGISTINVSHAGFSKLLSVRVGVFELRGDLDGDNDVDENDLSILRAALNTQATGPGDPRDLNNDGVIDVIDSQILADLCSRPECSAGEQAPTITCPDNLAVVNDPGRCSALEPFSVTATGVPIPTVVCRVGSGVIASPYSFPVGTTTVNCTATNSVGSANCSFSIAVRDNTPPTINGASVDKLVLWPPDHKMVDIMVSYTVTDNCALSTNPCTLRVSSNEPINGTGDGDTQPDWELVDAHHLRLRAERAANGSGRVYTITIRCTDNAGNSSNQNVIVTVPRDQR